MIAPFLSKPAPRRLLLSLAGASLVAFAACKGSDQGKTTPPAPQVVQVPDMNLLTIDPHEVAKFPLVTAEKVDVAAEVNATGSVNPDVSREVPVISLANGRVVDIKARLGDDVKKGDRKSVV